MLSLVTNGIVFLNAYAVWGFTISIIGRVLFQVKPPWGQVARIVDLSTAPLVFGLLVLIPWMGPFVGKVLNIWSLLILIGIVQYEFKIDFWGAVTCVVLGWLLSLAFTNRQAGHRPAQQGIPEGFRVQARQDKRGHLAALWRCHL